MKMMKYSILLVTLCIFSSCFYDDDENSIKKFNTDDFISIEADEENISADGVEFSMITAKLTSEVDSGKGMIEFTTTLGTFSNNEKTTLIKTNSNKEAKANLKSSEIGTANVVAKIGDLISNSVDLTFDEALPDTILISFGTLSHPNGIQNKLTISIQLIRSVGNPSKGFAINYSTEPSGIPEFVFGNGSLSNETGIATVDFAVKDTTFVGDVKITASLENFSNIKTSSTLVIVKSE